MQLSKRLQTIADSIPLNRNVIDVGCDHALLDIALVLDRNIHCTATDISAIAIEKAQETAKQYGVTDKITFYVNDGIKGLPIKKEDVIVITGMGAHTMLSILASLQEKHTLILSAHKDTELLRRTLCANGYFIQKEQLVFEKHWYFILTFKEGNKNYDEIDYQIGPMARYHAEYIDDLYEKEKQVSFFRKEKTDLLKRIETDILPEIKKNTV